VSTDEDCDAENSPRRKKQRVKPSAYNTFLKKEMAAILAANPNLPHKEVFKLADSKVVFCVQIDDEGFLSNASVHFKWRDAPENPKRGSSGGSTSVIEDEATTGKNEGVQRRPPYATFMKREMAAIKATDPSLSHKDVFKLAAIRVHSR